MIVPKFSLSQNDTFVLLRVEMPYVQIADLDLHIDGCGVKLHCRPFFLNLALPHPVVEDGQESAKYDHGSGVLNVKLPKETAGQEFPRLNMLTTLLQVSQMPEHASTSPAGIEVLSTSATTDSQPAEADGAEPAEHGVEIKPHYGFNNQYEGVLSVHMEELARNLIGLDDPDRTPSCERRGRRMDHENAQFDAEHYMGDFIEDEDLDELLAWKEPWLAASKGVGLGGGGGGGGCVELSDEDLDDMGHMKNKEFLIKTEEDEERLWMGLIDLIFGMCYDRRITSGESNVESHWTVCRLSSTLSWLDSFSNLDDVLAANYRAALSYPLFRHWRLAAAVHWDVAHLFCVGGLNGLLKAVLELRRVLGQKGDCGYLFRRLYLDDYAVWLQQVSDHRRVAIAQKLWRSVHGSSENDMVGISPACSDSSPPSKDSSGGSGALTDTVEDAQELLSSAKPTDAEILAASGAPSLPSAAAPVFEFGQAAPVSQQSASPTTTSSFTFVAPTSLAQSPSFVNDQVTTASLPAQVTDVPFTFAAPTLAQGTSPFPSVNVHDPAKQPNTAGAQVGAPVPAKVSDEGRIMHLKEPCKEPLSSSTMQDSVSPSQRRKKRSPKKSGPVASSQPSDAFAGFGAGVLFGPAPVAQPNPRQWWQEQLAAGVPEEMSVSKQQLGWDLELLEQDAIKRLSELDEDDEGVD